MYEDTLPYFFIAKYFLLSSMWIGHGLSALQLLLCGIFSYCSLNSYLQIWPGIALLNVSELDITLFRLKTSCSGSCNCLVLDVCFLWNSFANPTHPSLQFRVKREFFIELGGLAFTASPTSSLFPVATCGSTIGVNETLSRQFQIPFPRCSHSKKESSCCANQTNKFIHSLEKGSKKALVPVFDFNIWMNILVQIQSIEQMKTHA